MRTDDRKANARRNRRVDVIDAAIRVFWEKGYSAASVQDVAEEVGVLKGSLYHYIDSKEDLLFRIFDESHRQAAALLEEARALDASPLGRIAHYFRQYLRWYLANMERVSLYITEWRYLTGERREIVKVQRRAYGDFLREMLVEAQRKGDVPDDLNLRYTAAFLLGAVNAIPTWYRGNRAEASEEVVQTYVRLILSAVSTRPYEPESHSSIS